MYCCFFFLNLFMKDSCQSCIASLWLLHFITIGFWVPPCSVHYYFGFCELPTYLVINQSSLENERFPKYCQEGLYVYLITCIVHLICLIYFYYRNVQCLKSPLLRPFFLMAIEPFFIYIQIAKKEGN